MFFKQLLQQGILRIVGSILYKEDPRDLDLILYIDDDVFEQTFMPINEWLTPVPDKKAWSRGRWNWSDACIELSDHLSPWLQGTEYGVDLRIHPKSMLSKEMESGDRE